jgi:hypothetical protein
MEESINKLKLLAFAIPKHSQEQTNKLLCEYKQHPVVDTRSSINRRGAGYRKVQKASGAEKYIKCQGQKCTES